MPYMIALLLVVLAGCAQTTEVAKTIWGSSTRALEDARAEAITKTYDRGYWDCIRASLDVMAKESFQVFKKDEVKGYMVLMGIKGAVNTTEVGVFFEEVSENKVRIEISSLSTKAKRIVAKKLFHGMDIGFGLIPPDPVVEEPKEKDSKK